MEYTIDQAIAECKEFAKETNMFVGDPHAAKIAEWLTELKGLKNETPITETWLNAKFQYICGQWVVYSPSNDGDVTIFHRGRMYYISFNENAAGITTLGQLRMFLTMFGFGDFAQQLKA